MSLNNPELAINGSPPVRSNMLPYGSHYVNDQDIKSVINVLKSNWLTTGPMVQDFESALAEKTDSKYAVAVSSGTAALHAAMFALGIGPGDEVIVPAITFVATANSILYLGAKPIFVDVNENSLLIDVDKIENSISTKTRAIIVVDYAGQPCDYDSIRSICNKNGIALISDSCHALGAEYKSSKIGTISDMSTFSFHPVKHITTGEGGAITTNDKALADQMRIFRNHGISKDLHVRTRDVEHYYEAISLGFNYRLSDIQCSLGITQLSRLEDSVSKRQNIAFKYDEIFNQINRVSQLSISDDISHAYHLYVIKLKLEDTDVTRDNIFKALRAENIGVNVHYLPVYLHPLYKTLNYKKGICPVAEDVYENIISLPIFPNMNDDDINDVLKAVNKVMGSINE